MSRNNLKWKKVLGVDSTEEHRLRRGDLTLAVVAPAPGGWYFRGKMPDGASVNTLCRPETGAEGRRTWPNPDQAKEAAASWVLIAEAERRPGTAIQSGVDGTRWSG